MSKVLRVRQLHDQPYLCLFDARYKCRVLATDKLSFDKFTDDPRFIFSVTAVPGFNSPDIRVFKPETFPIAPRYQRS
ncbi:hypothetical protein SAMN05720354_12938 [Nitrosospira sp. Nsp1]|nr:hypothetical protein SAMN05720354_12938 [Nitrosospira sp. Nsp1]